MYPIKARLWLSLIYLAGNSNDILHRAVGSIICSKWTVARSAVTSARRSAAYPDLPTVAEAGVSGYVVEGWYGLYAPAGTAPDIVNLLNTSVAKAIRAGIFKTIETNEGLTFAPGTRKPSVVMCLRMQPGGGMS